MIGDRHAMRVAAQVSEGVLGAAEGTLGVDHPIRAEQRTQKSRERRRRSEMVQRAVKSELACGVEFAQARHELTAEHAAENFHGQEEVVPSWDPMAVVRRSEERRVGKEGKARG